MSDVKTDKTGALSNSQETKQGGTASSRLPELDLLRSVAVLMVILPVPIRKRKFGVGKII